MRCGLLGALFRASKPALARSRRRFVWPTPAAPSQGRPFYEHLGDGHVYSCAVCRVPIVRKEALLSKVRVGRVAFIEGVLSQPLNDVLPEPYFPFPPRQADGVMLQRQPCAGFPCALWQGLSLPPRGKCVYRCALGRLSCVETPASSGAGSGANLVSPCLTTHVV
eukprot:358752-Chlamydomonas_euryale.AAC.26